MDEQRDTGDSTTLHLAHFFPAARDRLFRALTRAEEISEWWEPDARTVEEAAVDLRTGGTFRLVLHKDGSSIVCEGIYRELDPPRRVVMSWSVDRQQRTLTLELEEKGAATELRLVEDGVPAAEQARVEDWWRQCFELLGEFLGRDSRRETLEPYP